MLSFLKYLLNDMHSYLTGSLSSFDAHSVHSSVVSEYSRRASEVVSPSELPDSPSETMPPSPRKTPPPDKSGRPTAGQAGLQTFNDILRHLPSNLVKPIPTKDGANHVFIETGK